MASKKKLYLVQRLAWCTFGDQEFRRGMCQQHESVEGVPVGAFQTKARASKHAGELTAQARRELNPFQFSLDIEWLTTGGEDQLLSTLSEIGLPDPTKPLPKNRVTKFVGVDWPAWYDDIADTLTDAERDAIWNLLDRLELYRVVEVEFLLEM